MKSVIRKRKESEMDDGAIDVSDMYDKPMQMDPDSFTDHCLMKKKVLQADWDWWTVYEGSEGVGKSTAAIWDAYLTSGELFSFENSICFDPDEFLRLVDDTPRYGSIILDEAGTAWFNRDFATLTNKCLAKCSQQMRDRNLNILLCVPDFRLLDRVAVIRHRTWGFCTAPNFERGLCEFMEPHWDKFKGGGTFPFWETMFFEWFNALPEAKYKVYKEIKTKKSKELFLTFREEIGRIKEKDLGYRLRPQELVKRILEDRDKEKYLGQRKRYDRDLVRYELGISDRLARAVCQILNKEETHGRTE